VSAPEHHPLCFKDGCLGVDGGCCLAAYWRGCEDADAQRGNATPDALDRLRHTASAVCNSEGIPLDDDMVEVRADRLSELRKEIDNGANVAAEAARITDLRRVARSVVQAWQVERADKFSADWHAEFRCLESALRAFPNPIVVPKEPRG